MRRNRDTSFEAQVRVPETAGGESAEAGKCRAWRSPGSGGGVGGVARAEGSDARFFLREFRAALPAAAFRMRPGWLAVEEWVPGDDQAGARRLGLGSAATDGGSH